MRIRDEIRLTVGTLLLVQVLMMIAAVGLLARMTPAIEQILEENEKSIGAVEQMALALAADPGGDDERLATRRITFERALAVAQGNVTEQREAPALADIDASYRAALNRDPAALELVRARLLELGEINRQTMIDANEDAKRMGAAGAWSLVFLGIVGLMGSLALTRRARVKLITPVYELGAVLDACKANDRYRRASLHAAAAEFHDVALVVNDLVDERFSRREHDWERAAKLDRVSLLAMLDREPTPTLTCDAEGAIVAANAAALERLDARGESTRAAIRELTEGSTPRGLRAEALRGGGWICWFDDPGRAPEPPHAEPLEPTR